MERKYIFFTGGVVSTIGKGITAASLGLLLKNRGYRVSMLKLDPYYNINPGLLSPLQHGESFITEDGAATDLAIGHYERFVDITLSGDSNITTGKIHQALIKHELNGDYNGDTVQVIPHVTNEIKQCIEETAEKDKAEIVIVEIGGTVGDLESAAYMEAIRQMRLNKTKNSCCYVHVTLVPYIAAASELKTKPTQHSVKALRSIGIQPDVIVCRSQKPLSNSQKDKIALFCNVKPENVIQNDDTSNIYEVPLLLEKENFSENVCKILNIPAKTLDISNWNSFVEKSKSLNKQINVALVGKYVALHDAYLSDAEALKHAGINNDAKVNISWIDSKNINQNNVEKLLQDFDAIITPGGFGAKGAEGISITAEYARVKNIPYLAVGFGMQLSIVAAVRNLLGIQDANISEADPNTRNAIATIPENKVCQNDSRSNARLGGQDIKVLGGKLKNIYNCTTIHERHSNRYEINMEYNDSLAEHGFVMTAVTENGLYPEAYEYSKNDFYICVLFHPEFISRPNKPHPLINEFIKVAIKNKHI